MSICTLYVSKNPAAAPGKTRDIIPAPIVAPHIGAPIPQVCIAARPIIVRIMFRTELPVFFAARALSLMFRTRQVTTIDVVSMRRKESIMKYP